MTIPWLQFSTRVAHFLGVTLPEETDFEVGVEGWGRGDYDRAVREFLPLADQGHAQAQVNLGIIYSLGLLLTLYLFFPPLVLAQVAVVIKPVNLREDPSTNNPPIRLLLPPERLKLVPPKEQGGYYRVKTEANENGWAWKPSVKVYDRGDWKHWTDADGDCQKTRQEVLIAESTIPVTLSPNGCRVESGRWVGPYSGEVFTDPGDLQVDHMVPLANTHVSGGWAWNSQRKEDYANDMENPGHLIAVKAGLNMSKGAKSPDKWKPPREEFWCEYATIWLGVKEKWNLTLTAAEAKAVAEMMGSCL